MVGLIRPNLFALGAAMGHFDAEMRSSAIWLAGMRIPTVGKPDVTISGTKVLLGSTMVSGPGQNCSANL